MIELSQLGPLLDVRGLFARERSAFLELLGGLGVGDWDRTTVCPGWTVKDVTAHVLHDDLRRLAGMRDGHQGPPRDDGEPLAVFSARVNQEWVAAARCLSTRQLVELLTLTGGQVAGMWQQQDLEADATAVSWAGLDTSPVWLDAAREFTEYWTHQQQVRDATSRPGLTGSAFLVPVLDTFLRALPFTLANTDAAPGAQVTITGEAAMVWVATRESTGWRSDRGAAGRPVVLVEADGDTMWRLCTRSITPQAARARVRVHGDPGLGDQVLEIVSIIW
jgi:uncharacterized protein (TIGR03083 family)